MVMHRIFLIAALTACGGSQSPTGSTGPDQPVASDTRSELERRRDAGCEQLGPKITECALADAKAALAAGSIKQAQFDQDTAPAVLKKNTSEFIDQCKTHQLSSRQVRVLEVCFKEEQECDPLLACLDNLNAPGAN
ncbi:MAG: hypothetical protein AB7O24_22605 [Kofleriaceae bacterium]